MVDSHRIRYLQSGSSKRTLVLLHGLGASAERWNPVAPLYAKHFRVIVPDMIGFGMSDKPSADYTPAYLSDFLDGFLSSLGLARVRIVGSSMGGMIALLYSLSHPDRVQRQVLVSPAGFMSKSTPALDAYIMAALYPDNTNAANAFKMMAGGREKVARSVIDGFVERMHMPNAKLAFMSALMGMHSTKITQDQIAAVSVPTMLVWGRADAVIPISHAANFEAIPECTYVPLIRRGHTPYVQNPDEFFSLTRDFLMKN